MGSRSPGSLGKDSGPSTRNNPAPARPNKPGPTGGGGKAGGEPDGWWVEWVIITRLKHYVDSWVPGMEPGTWSPIFRSRRLASGAKFRVQANSAASVATADGRTAVLTTGDHEIICEVSYFRLSAEGRAKVFDLRSAKVYEDVMRFFGKQSRFDIIENVNHGRGGTMAPRG